MTDLREEFGKLRRLNPPEHLWSRVEEIQERGVWTDSPKRGRVLTTVIGIGIAFAGLALAVVAFSRGDGPLTSGPSPGSQSAGGPLSNGKIAFVSGRGGYAIDTVQPGGTGWTDLTDPIGQEYDSSPTWSPDGSRLAFLRYTIEGEAADNQLMVADADGSAAVQLTHGLSVADPVWSPTGTMIAIVVVGADGSLDVFALNADGTSLKRLTDNPGHDLSPSWSPDGEKIVYESEVDGDFDIYSMAADGSAESRLTENPGYDGQPSWSPLGSKIAFVSDHGEGTDLYTMIPDGSGQTMIADLVDDRIGSLTWSPDGSLLAFQAFDRETSWDIWIADADGAEVARLTNEPGDETGPVWSPDGRFIAYAASKQGGFGDEHTGTSDIYVMKRDGSGSRRLVANALASCCSLTWQPVVAREATG